MLSLCYKLLSWLFIPSILDIPTNDIFTKGMSLALCRLLTQLPLLLFSYVLFRILFHLLHKNGGIHLLLEFKLSHHFNFHSSNLSYDMKIVKDMKTGQTITIPMMDRFLHTLVDGSSGTAKTSSTFLPSIRDDLNLRCEIEDKLKLELSKLVDSKDITPISETKSFHISDFKIIGENYKNIEQKLKEYKQSYPVCGITILAPDDSLTDSVCELCISRNISFNRIDPIKQENGDVKEQSIGMNPFYIPPKYTGTKKDELVVKRAIIFADVMQAITDLKGSADSYFTSINRQMLCNISILAMLTVPILDQRQATPENLQIFINNFDTMLRYVEVLSDADKTARKYTIITEYIRNELLGKGRTKMEDQCRGTRNIINEFLLLPANKEIFCSQHSIDFDLILERNEVTVFNYNLSSGDTDATALGLLFLLSFNTAVLSRPGTERSRTPHFFYIDEFPVLLHPSLEKNFSLFRKYRVGMFVAIQTVDQFEKNTLTKYLKGVVLGCANIIIFGRSSLSDMLLFSKFGGTQDIMEEQSSISETALSDSNTSLSYTLRETLTNKNIVDETKIRMKDFQEVTFFVTKNGRPLLPIHGKVQFLKKSDWKYKKRPNFENLCMVSQKTPILFATNATYEESSSGNNDNLQFSLNATYLKDTQEKVDTDLDTPIIQEPTLVEQKIKIDDNIEDLYL